MTSTRHWWRSCHPQAESTSPVQVFQSGAGLSQLVALVQHCPTPPMPGDLVEAMLALVREGTASGPWAAEAFGRVIGLDDLPRLADAVRRGPDAKATHPAAVERALAALQRRRRRQGRRTPRFQPISLDRGSDMTDVLRPHAEQEYADELAALAGPTTGPARPAGGSRRGRW